MASHGVPRPASNEVKSVEARAREAEEIERYQKLVDAVESQMRQGDFSPELLQKTTDILKINPEYYTIWNHRRRIYVHEFNTIYGQQQQPQNEELTEENRESQVLDIIQLDLQFLLPLLIQFPKCYWIWNHRLWLLEQATTLLPAVKARPFWEEELQLVAKMLSRDSRNFHGWGYRRTIIDNLESKALDGRSMAKEELDYTTKMIGTNLSNFSAWHNRTKLITRMLNEQSADEEERRQMLDRELALIHKALFDPYDQSLWFYHQNLLCTFDPSRACDSIAPQLSDDDRLEYLDREIEFVEEMVDDTDDCKWIYQALIECKLLTAKIQGSMSKEDQDSVQAWLGKLKNLDQLRKGRWNDLESKLGLSVLSSQP